MMRIDNKEGIGVAVFLDDEENEVVINKKNSEGLSSKNIAIKKIIRDYGGLKDIVFRG